MVDLVIDYLASNIPTEQIAAETGLSTSDIEAIRTSPLVQLRLSVVGEDMNND